MLIPSALCIPFICYNISQIYKYRNEGFVKKRGQSLVFGYNLAIAVILITFAVMMSGSLYFPKGNEYSEIISVVITYCIFFFLNVRSWMIYYNYHWTHYTLQFKWQRIINHNIVRDESKHNWFIKNKSKYGRLHYVYKLFGSIHLILGVIVCIMASLYKTFGDKFRFVMIMLMITSTLMLVIFYSIIVSKTPFVRDIYYIHRENKLSARILIIGHILLLITTGIIAQFFRDDSPNTWHRAIAVCGAYPMLLMWSSISYLSTIVVIKKNLKREREP